MNLIFKHIGNATHKSNFLEHIHELHHVKLEKGDTYNVLFNKVITKFEGEPEKLKAAEDWISFNKEEMTPEQFDIVIKKDDTDAYAIFDLKP